MRMPKHNRKKDDHFRVRQGEPSTYMALHLVSNAVPKHRLVAGGVDRWALGNLTFGGKVVLETPRPVNEVRCSGALQAPMVRLASLVECGAARHWQLPRWGRYVGVTRTVDLQATKEFRFGDRYQDVLREINLLNAFNYKNYSTASQPSKRARTAYTTPLCVYNEVRRHVLQCRALLSVELGMRF